MLKTDSKTMLGKKKSPKNTAMHFKCTLKINYDAKSPNTFSVLKIFNLVEVLNGKLPSFSFPSTSESHPKLLFFTSCYHSRVTSSKHMVSSTQHELMILSPSPFRHLPTYPASCLEGSLEYPTSSQSPHPSHILLLISSPATPAKNPESPDFCL